MNFTFTTAGESHGPSLTVIVTGVPAGLRLNRERIDLEMRRRQLGYGRSSRMKIENDLVEITGGVRGGKTLGSPVAMVIRNRDFENWQGATGVWEMNRAEAEKRRVISPRPGHADLAGGMKFDHHDLRDVLERASARETAARVAAGAVAKRLLEEFGIEVASKVLSIGRSGDPAATPPWESLAADDSETQLRAWDHALEQQFIAEVDAARDEGETLGGVLAVAAHGVPVGLGSYTQWTEKLDGRIARAIMSVHAVKAVALGDAISAVQERGSAVHDAIFFDPSRGYHRNTNRAGGLEGGVTNGEMIFVRAFMKPIATVRRGVPSVNIETHEAERSQWERSDVTAVAACGVVCEAMLAVTLADAMREKFGGDSLEEMRRNYASYLAQLSRY